MSIASADRSARRATDPSRLGERAIGRHESPQHRRDQPHRIGRMLPGVASERFGIARYGSLSMADTWIPFLTILRLSGRQVARRGVLTNRLRSPAPSGSIGRAGVLADRARSRRSARATAPPVHWPSVHPLRCPARSVAGRLDDLRGLMQCETICKAWTDEPEGSSPTRTSDTVGAGISSSCLSFGSG